MSAVLTTLATLTAGLLAAGPAEAATRTTPGSFTGYAFDTCEAPSQEQMDAWLTHSPFWGVGVYFGGSMRQCDEQPNLTAAWVKRQSARGWRVLPIWVGPQASCTTYAERIDPTAANRYSAARAQGRAEATTAARTADALGVGRDSTLWYDLEDFALDDDDCRRSALSFLSAWTDRLHELGYRSGVYSNVAAAIHALDNADKLSPGSYTMPDQVWYAWGNGRADTAIPQKWVRADSWAPRARVHQYQLDTVATYAGVTLEIDRNFMDVGRGSTAPKAPRSCGVRVDFADYRALRRGSTGGQVKALQCLLKQRGSYDGRVHGRLDRATDRAVRALQRSHALRATGRVTADTWTALLSEGTSPVLKHGSASNAVRRLQRALNVDRRVDLRVTGVFTAATTRAVRGYQRDRGLPLTGVVADDTWAQLQAGRR